MADFEIEGDVGKVDFCLVGCEGVMGRGGEDLWVGVYECVGLVGAT